MCGEMKQTKKMSMLEAWVNIGFGYIINVAVQFTVYPFFGIDIPISTNLWIGLIFTVVSLLRTYGIRRWFNNNGKINNNGK